MTTSNKASIFVGIVPYSLRKSKDLRSIPLNQLITQDHKCKEGVIGDLTSNDHIVIYISSRAILLRRLSKIKCKISLIISEPKCVHQRYYKLLPLWRHKFHKIFTNYTYLSNKYSNVTSIPIAYTWIKETANTEHKKDKLISIIASKKWKHPGHKLRHKVIDSLPEGSCDFLGRAYKPFVNKSDGLSPYMYSIVIENCQEVDYFTEKIVDCFICRTVPIYWGAGNISDHFDDKGILSFQTIDELHSVLEKISKEDYISRSVAIDNNRKIAKNICRVDKKIISLLKNE